MAVNSDKDGVTAELYKVIVSIVDDRVKEIRVTREDFDELRRALNELAGAQARTEERVGRLEDAVEKGERIVILGEAKSRIYRREVEDFIKAVEKLKIKDKVFKVMFGFFIHPSASEVAKKEGIVLVASYQR